MRALCRCGFARTGAQRRISANHPPAQTRHRQNHAPAHHPTPTGLPAAAPAWRQPRL